MSWFKLDDEMPWHPKIALAGGDAAWLWVCAGCYSAKHGLDGRVPKSILAQLTDRKAAPRLVDRLLAANLFEDAGDYVLVHDYLEFNPSADEVAAKRAARSEAGKAGGKRSGESRRSKPPSEPEANHEANASANGKQPRSTEPSKNEPRTPVQEPDGSCRRGYTKAQRDPVFSALSALFGEPTTRTTKAFYGSSVTEFLDADATADEVILRGERLKAKGWHDCSPKALLKHWHALASPEPSVDPDAISRRGTA